MKDNLFVRINNNRTEKEMEVIHLIKLLDNDYSSTPITEKALYKTIIMLLYSNWEGLIKYITQDYIKTIYKEVSLINIPDNIIRYSLEKNFFQTDKVEAGKSKENIIKFINDPLKSLNIFIDTKNNLGYEVFFEIISNNINKGKNRIKSNLIKNSRIFKKVPIEKIDEYLKFFLNETLLNYRNTFSHGGIIENYNEEKIKHWITNLKNNLCLFQDLELYIHTESIYVGKNKKIEKVFNELIFTKEFIKDIKNILFDIIESYIDLLSTEYELIKK